MWRNIYWKSDVVLDEEALINFGNWPETFSEEQLEHLAEVYSIYKNDLTEAHIKQVLEYIERKKQSGISIR